MRGWSCFWLDFEGQLLTRPKYLPFLNQKATEKIFQAISSPIQNDGQQMKVRLTRMKRSIGGHQINFESAFYGGDYDDFEW